MPYLDHKVNFAPFQAFWPKINWFTTWKVVCSWTQRIAGFSSANRNAISGCVISLERKHNAAMESMMEKVKSDKYLQ